jgi:hypothetical protein
MDDQYRYNVVPFRPAHLSPEELRQGCFEARKAFYSWSSIMQRGLDVVNRRTGFMFSQFLWVNAMVRAEVRLRDNYPLGDEAWQGQLLRAA